MEKITPYSSKPWHPKLNIYIAKDREEATTTAKTHVGIQISVDGSCRNNRVGIGIYHGSGDAVSSLLGTIPTASSPSDSLLSELFAIYEAIHQLRRNLQNMRAQNATTTIFSDSQHALRLLQNPRQQSGQWLLAKILEEEKNLRVEGHKLQIKWVPGHAKVEGNEKANAAARMATKKSGNQREAPATTSVPFPLFKATLLAAARAYYKTIQLDTKFGKYTRNLDHAVPGKHTKVLYNRLNRQEAEILCQVRTDKSRLNASLYS